MVLAKIKHKRTNVAGSLGLRDLKSLLDASAIPREVEWDGEFKGSGGSCRSLDFVLRLKLRITATMIEGLARGVDFPRQSHESREFAVVGSRAAGLTDFELHPEATFLKGTPFVCSGEIGRDESMISGSFSLQCFSKPECICEGGSGELLAKTVSSYRVAP